MVFGSILSNKTSKLGVIGNTEYISIGKLSKIPAKIDTGADSSSIWASNIEVKKDGTLTFKLFAPSSPHYTGETLQSTDYTISSVRSSNGIKQIRYRTKLKIALGNQIIETNFTLANRRRNIFPVLIGRKTISGLFLVDVSKSAVKLKAPKKIEKLGPKFRKDPYKFHQTYIKKSKTEKSS